MSEPTPAPRRGRRRATPPEAARVNPLAVALAEPVPTLDVTLLGGTAETLAQRAHAIVLRGRRASAAADMQWTAPALAIIKARELYRDLGHETFPSYLKDPAVDISTMHAHRLVHIAHDLYPGLRALLAPPPDGEQAATDTVLVPGPEPGTLVDTATGEVVSAGDVPALAPADLAVPVAEVLALGVHKAAIVLPLIKAHPEDAEDWLAKGRELASGDLELEVRRTRQPNGELSAVDEWQQELARKLAAIVYHFRGTHDPAPVLDELIAAARDGRAYYDQIAPEPAPETASEPEYDAELVETAGVP